MECAQPMGRMGSGLYELQALEAGEGVCACMPGRHELAGGTEAATLGYCRGTVGVV